jgi:hypothetical protein
VKIDFPVPLRLEGGFYSHVGTRLIDGAEFRLSSGSRIIWGQGLDYDAKDYYLHPEDAASILAGGGG